MRSPENTAVPALVVSRTETWPGVWPIDGSKRSQGSIWCVSSTSVAWPEATIGSTLSSMQPYSSPPRSFSCFQNCHSSPGKT